MNNELMDFINSVRRNVYYKYLIILFIILVFIKFLFSLIVPSPWIADEIVYAETARNVLKGNLFSNLIYCQTYPPGYSIILSFAYLFSDDVAKVYHIMLFINCILTSTIIIPSYFILQRYCNKKISFLGSATIATLPAVTLYTFVLMSENLFIPLFMFSGWFLLNSYSEEKKSWRSWHFLAGFSIFYLFLTRTTGIAMIVGFFLSFIYFLFARAKFRAKQEGISTAIRDKYCLILSFAVPMSVWILYKTEHSVSGYNTDSYYNALFDIFVNLESLKIFLSLLLHELEFFTLSSYFIVFLMACLFIFKISKVIKDHFLLKCNSDNRQDIEGDIALISLFLYISVSSFFLILITIIHMYISLANGSLYYLIFARYIDPIVPMIFLFGIIEISRICNKGCKLDNKKTIHFFLILITVLTIFIISFPHDYYKFPNMFSIFYIQYVKSMIPVEILIAILFITISLIFYFSICRSSPPSPEYLFVFIIIISLLISVHPFQVQLDHSYSGDRAGQIGKYLNKISDSNTTVFMDRYNDAPARMPDLMWHSMMWYNTIFWMNGYLVHHSMDHDSLLELEGDYIISPRMLPYTPIMSSMNYILYKLEPIKEPHLTHVRYLQNWNPQEDWSGTPTRWMKNDAILVIESDQDRDTEINFLATSYLRPRTLEIYDSNDNLIGRSIIPRSLISVGMPISLKRGTNTLRLHIPEGCEGGTIPGSRCLSIAVQNVTISPLLRETKLFHIKYFKNWHGLEDWDGTSTRWIENDAILAIESDQNRTADLTFQAVSFIHPRTLEIYDSNDDLIARAIIPRSLNSVDMPISLKIGTNTLRLHIPEGCEIPYDVTEGKSSDIRCLSVAVQNMTLS